MKFIRINVGQRLALGFGLLLALLAAACAVATFELRQVAESTRQTIEQDWAKAEAATQIDTLTRANARRTMELLIVTDPARIAIIDERIAANRKGVDEALATLDRLVARPDGKELLARVKERRAAFVASFTKVRALVGEGRRDDAVGLVNSQTLPAIDALQEPVRALSALQKKIVAESAAEVNRNIHRALAMMMGLAAAGLVIGIVAARLISRSITAPVKVALVLAQQVAAGDLTARIEVQGHDELAQLLGALRGMNDGLARIVTEVRTGTESISTATSQIASGNMDLSQRTEEQASALQEIAASIEQLTSAVESNLEGSSHATQVAAQAADVAVRGGALVSQVVQTMEAINTSSGRIANIVGVIDSIAFQTNILALNAAVEAARAGEEGRGFAVVATEVRNLAGRSASAAREIKGLIDESVGSVADGCMLVEQAGSTMDEIVVSVRRVADIMADLNVASREQSSGISQINQAIGQMDQVTQSNAALVEEAAAAAQALERQSRALVDTVDVFKLAPGAA